MVMHSLGGGTGSGLGSFTLSRVAEEYPKELKFSTCVLPSENDDVIVSPYNTSLALNVLMESADCILPVDNKALFEIVGRIEDNYSKKKGALGAYKQGSSIMDLDPADPAKGKKSKKSQEYNRENTIVANMLSDLTCSMRYEGTLNIDLNEITMNLVPFPRMKFLMSSLSPLYTLLDPGAIPRGISQMFDDAINKNYQMLSVSQKATTETMYLACGLITRGSVGISDLNANVEKIKRKIRMPYWNTEGFKIGLCSQPSLTQDYSLLFLSNNSSVGEIIGRIKNKFMGLYQKKTFLHHFTKVGVEESYFEHVRENIEELMQNYEQCESWAQPPASTEGESGDEDDGVFKYHIY